MSREVVDSVMMREVIEVRFLRGAGVSLDPMRVVTAYYAPDGYKLAEHDPLPDPIAPDDPSEAQALFDATRLPMDGQKW